MLHVQNELREMEFWAWVDIYQRSFLAQSDENGTT